MCFYLCIYVHICTYIGNYVQIYIQFYDYHKKHIHAAATIKSGSHNFAVVQFKCILNE